MEQGEAVRRREAEKRKNEARRRRQKKRKRQQMFARSVMVLTGAVFVGVILYGGWRLSHRAAQAQEERSWQRKRNILQTARIFLWSF